MIYLGGVRVIFVEGAQFRLPSEIDCLVSYADSYGKLLFFYGLLTDVDERLFTGSRRIIEKGARLEALKTTCQVRGCMDLATHHLRFLGGG